MVDTNFVIIRKNDVKARGVKERKSINLRLKMIMVYVPTNNVRTRLWWVVQLGILHQKAKLICFGIFFLKLWERRRKRKNDRR